ncbi:cyclin-like protein [Umbelopsis sp. PMI_123]|nr:cyclin-like protein [Umbelopsis sp. PMI_123]
MATTEDSTVTSESSASETLPLLYEQTSQFRHWRFSHAQLHEIRDIANAAAVEIVKTNYEQELEVNKDSGNDNDTLQFLTADEELSLCIFYESRLQTMCKMVKLPDIVMYTAVMYMKRFFLNNTVMDYHPKDVLYTCLFLATKAENERLSIDEFCQKLRVPSADSVLNLEFTVSQGLKFEYCIYHPYRAAYGLFLDLQSVITEVKTLKSLHNKAQAIISKLVLTDVPFVYQPSQIALMAFMLADDDPDIQTFINSYIDLRFADQKAMLISIRDDVADILKNFKLVTTDEAKSIDRRLRSCTNPAKNPDSSIYKKRQAEKEKADEEKRIKKLKERELSRESLNDVVVAGDNESDD